ncbi:hypothetical protein IMZ48_16620 [Candidatus Bathyarchaeota archaeon]|nr:hypothetical protein [Candidatus Bathyarchaeota archaeon]
MEHLQLVEGARQPSLTIPLVVKSASEFPYTSGSDDFIDFPNNHLREIRFIHPDISASDTFSSLVQSWLFFGTLSQFFKRSVSIESFSRLNAAGERVLCTSGLGNLRAAWIASLPRRSYFTAAVRQLESRRCAVLLARATFVYSRIQDLAIDDALLQRVLFSVKLMLSSLCQTIRVVLGPTPTLDAIITRLAFRPAAQDWSSKSDFLLWDYMVENVWCPHQINTLLGVYTPTTMIYLASMRRKGHHGDHRDCLHAGYCKASQIDWAHFQTPHVSTGCTCAHVAVDEQRMMEKLEDGQIPLLSCTRGLSGDFSVEITHVDMQRAFGARTPYFAISHVSPPPLSTVAAFRIPCESRFRDVRG